MKNQNSKSDKSKRESLDESSDEDGSSNDENSDSVVIIDNESDKGGTSDSDEGSSSDSSSIVQIKSNKRTPMRPSILMSDTSDSGDETSDKCGICLRSILNQEVGSPEGCDHIFCSVCIIEWSKKSNVCPFDRQQFSIILIRKSKDDKIVKQLPVEEPKTNYEYEEDDDLTFCELCGASDREDTMLLCDGCQGGFHMECLTPPLEEVPAEDEWFCPSCAAADPAQQENEILEVIDEDFETSLRRRQGTLRQTDMYGRSRSGRRIRTRLLERIRVAVNTRDSMSDESFASESQPGTSGTQSRVRRKTTRKKRKTKRTTKKRKATARKKTVKSKSTTRTKSTKSKTGGETVKVVKRRTYKKRRKQKVKRKVKTAASRRSSASTTPKTVRGRLALKLGIVPAKRPGQLVPEVKTRKSDVDVSLNISRARAGIPTLHIFEPRNELEWCPSGSDGEDGSEDGGPVAAVAQPRITVSSIRDRKRAALLLQSPSTVPAKPKVLVLDPPKEVDILGSILESQAIWHSKNTNWRRNPDGNIEVISKPEKTDKKPDLGKDKPLDVRGTTSEGCTTQAPLYPGSSSRPGGFRPYNRSSFGDARGSQDTSVSARESSSQSGIGFSRFGGTARNDREGYANYLNNMPQGPTPFCRGGPPLRFRMPSRQQLRRIPFPPRINRSPWQNEGEEDNEAKNTDREEQSGNSQSGDKKTEEEDVDLYSDIEANADRGDSPEREESGVAPTSYPALGPPPEPPAFLLGLGENGEIGADKSKSEVYDPAEPCDSEDEMVIDENAKPPSPRDKEAEQKPLASEPPKSDTCSPADARSPKESSCRRGSTEDEGDECPIFSIYSSASIEFSQKGEEEREREIAEYKRKLEEMELRDKKSQAELEPPKETLEPKDTDKEKKEDSEARKNTERADQIESGAPSESRRSKSIEKVERRTSPGPDKDYKTHSQDEGDERAKVPRSEQYIVTRSRSGTPLESERRSTSPSPSKPATRRSSVDSEKCPPSSGRDKSSSPEKSAGKASPSRRSKSVDSHSGSESKKRRSDEDDDDDDDKGIESVRKEGKAADSEGGAAPVKVATGLEGLDVVEVSSDNGDDDDFGDRRSLSSLSLSELSNRSRDSPSCLSTKKKKKKRKRKTPRKTGGKKYEGDEDDDEEEKKLKSSGGNAEKMGDEDIENVGQAEKHKRRRSISRDSDRQILGNKENKKERADNDKEKDLWWKKPSKKKNYREGKMRSKERGRSRSKERRKSKSPSPKKDKKKGKDRKRKSEKKKDIERYDVRKIVRNKEIRRTDAFGRDILSKSRSISRSRSRTPIRDRSRNMLRRDSRSYSRSRSRSYRRGRSPIRRRYLRSRTKSRSKSLRRSYSRSRSRSRSIRKSKKKLKSKERPKGRSRSRGRKSRSRRRSLTRSRSRSQLPRALRGGKKTRSRRSWSRHSRSLSFSPRRTRSISRTPVRVRRSYSRSVSSSWSRGRSPIPRAASLEKLTVVLKTKDKKKGKKKKEGKRGKRDDERRKRIGNSKEVFASGDNVLVSVNFRNNNNASSNNNNGSASTEAIRNARLDSMSPPPTDRRKKRASDYEVDRLSKKSKKSNPISKNVVDMALSNSFQKRAKKLTRLSEKDAEVILNRKPVAVIDLDMSPYREQTPSPINVVVVSDSGSGDEGKETTPQRQNVRGSPVSEAGKNQESADATSANVSAPGSPVANGYLTGPKTPPEPQIKFSIAKPQQLRQIANPLGDDDDDEEEEEDAEEEEAQDFKRIESLDRRIEKELDAAHKGPNTPPEPRGPTTPQTPPSPQTSPDAYDPFEPTKSRSPTPTPTDKENRSSPAQDKDEQQGGVLSDPSIAPLSGTNVGDSDKSVTDTSADVHDDKPSSEVVEKETVSGVEGVVVSSQVTVLSAAPAQDMRQEESPERKISVVITTQQGKSQAQTGSQKQYAPVMKPTMVPATSVPSSVVAPFSFSLTSPTKTTRASAVPVSAPSQMTGIQRLQHRLGSPVNRTPNSVKSTPRMDSNVTSGSTPAPTAAAAASATKRNGEQGKQTRPLQDATNETIDVTLDLEDSPYSPASSEGDYLFDPPMETGKVTQSSGVKVIQPGYKPPQTMPTSQHKSPVKQLSKFDLLFGPSGPALSPLKVASKKPKPNSKPVIPPKTTPLNAKTTKKPTSKRGSSLKMDEDQLRILDELPSSAVELQVKDKFLKKLNRQERVVDEIKTVLKPHYARKHITKEEYKDILRRSVPKICHSRSGEINPSKIQSLIEAYVRKFRHAKKKGISAVSTGSNAVAKAKVK